MVFFPSALPAFSEKGFAEEGKTKTSGRFTGRVDSAPPPLSSLLMLCQDVSDEE